MGWPLLLGTAITSVFYVLVFRGPLDLPAVHRYFASHPVAFVATSMFFVGIAALALKLVDVAIQLWAINQVDLEEPPAGGQKLDEVPGLLDSLGQLPDAIRNSYLARRLRDALRFVQKQGDTGDLNDELKYLADMDVARQQDSLALVRIIIWATPMLGFLGTVIGITQALGDLDAKQLATDIQGAMDGLLSGLYVAFDTTALALSLSILLMFLMFVIDRMETQVLASVDLRANEALVGRFQQVGGSHDPYLNSIGKMCQQVVSMTETLVQRQAELWQGTVHDAQQQWSQVSQQSTSLMQNALQEALDNSLESFADRMLVLESENSARVQKRWEQLQTALADNARVMQEQQRELIRQGEVMGEVVQATGDVIKLEKSLNENLQALAGAKNFEDTVMSLSAAIHLMSTRLGTGAAQTPAVELQASTSKDRAA
jgi:biopolymer transport protein ExbB/TolQ